MNTDHPPGNYGFNCSGQIRWQGPGPEPMAVAAPWQAQKIPNDRLGRWVVVGESAGYGKPIVADKLRGESIARVVAAAPELLEAAEYCMDWIAAGPDGARAHAKLRRAIAKATGSAL